LELADYNKTLSIDLFDRDEYSSSTDSNGNKRYYKNGYYHREDGPAVISDKEERWYYEGLLHREDGPAVCNSEYNVEEYWIHGKSHRTDGPAIIDIYGTKFWYLDDLLHREDGPAVEYLNEYKEFWFKGKQIEVSSTEEYLRYLKLKIFF